MVQIERAHIQESKVLTYERTIEVVRKLKELGLRIVLVQGVFDILHIGHIEHLKAAKCFGDILIVGLENDLTVAMNKGVGRPVNSLESRSRLLGELQVVDYVFGFNTAPMYGSDDELYTQRYLDLKPDVVAISSWGSHLDKILHQLGNAGVGSAILDNPKQDSTTNILNRI